MKWTGGILFGFVAAVVLVLALIDWNMLRGPIGNYLSGRLHRQVVIAGDLDVRLFSWTPTAVVNRIRIAQPEWVQQARPQTASELFADFERLTVSIDLRRLFAFDVVLPELRVDAPAFNLLRTQEGRANWHFDEGAAQQAFRLPAIRHFVIHDGRLDLADAKRNLTFTGRISSEESDRATAEQFFSLTGDGRLNNAPFTLEVRGDPLLNVDPDAPYGFDAHVRAGATRIDAKGTLGEPFDLGGFDIAATFAGPDLADLYYLTGLTFPNTRAYRLSGHFTRDQDHYLFRDFGGTVGDSDLHGDLTVDASGEKPYLRADIASRRLDFDDLGPLIGAKPSSGGATTAPASQNAGTNQRQTVARVLPDTPLQVERLRQMNADVAYRADDVVSRDFPLRGAATKLSLKDGVLKLTPVTFTFARGTLNGDVQIDARKDVPVSDIDVRVTGLRLDQFLAAGSGPPALEGVGTARAKLHGVGNSIHRAASTADGTVTVVVPSGAVRQTFAELLGINVASALGLLITGDQSQVDVRCAVANFSARGGTLTLNQFAFDTPVVLASGEGSIDLRTERMNVAVTGHPKRPQLVRLRAPITITGPIDQPSIGVKPGTAIVQGGIAAALATVLSPLAAILPFVDPGLAEDANCAALLAEARALGAPGTPTAQARP